MPAVASSRRFFWTLLLAVGLLALCAFASEEVEETTLIYEHNAVYESRQQNVIRPNSPESKSPSPQKRPKSPELSPAGVANVLQDLHSALSTMQDQYFSLWLGTWTTAIDWTAAVMGTHLASTLASLSHSLTYTMPGTFDKSRKLDVEAQMIENEINKYFSQSITYFFGEDVFGIRMQAYDDMLWVVLGWLESIQFINSHSERHYPLTDDRSKEESEWHAKQFIPLFAHRSRIFYELAEQGWDWKLCGGGMVWAPQLGPYKNAITNELFISASVGMYLYFPGDDNCSPFMSAQDSGKGPDRRKLRKQELGDSGICDESAPRSIYEPTYLQAAINGYDWLKNSHMQNDQGLYVDGFHIRDYGKNGSIGTGKCDVRNEMVYTYNQGVILSGLRQLWEATGNLTYLENGHELVRSVIRATGWSDTEIHPTMSFVSKENHGKGKRGKKKPEADTLPPAWAGIGAHGILMEQCDYDGTCSQNDQTFKGILFHHLTTFCSPLPRSAVTPGKTHAASRETAALHHHSCNEYAPWVIHNARAALNTRDSEGKFGMWWGPGLHSRFAAEEPHVSSGQWALKHFPKPELPPHAIDYRNSAEYDDTDLHYDAERFVTSKNTGAKTSGDLNDRGRGRTVETQGGGIAVVKAMWEFLRNFDEGD